MKRRLAKWREIGEMVGRRGGTDSNLDRVARSSKAPGIEAMTLYFAPIGVATLQGINVKRAGRCFDVAAEPDLRRVTVLCRKAPNPDDLRLLAASTHKRCEQTLGYKKISGKLMRLAEPKANQYILTSSSCTSLSTFPAEVQGVQLLPRPEGACQPYWAWRRRHIGAAIKSNLGKPCCAERRHCTLSPYRTIGTCKTFAMSCAQNSLRAPPPVNPNSFWSPLPSPSAFCASANENATPSSTARVIALRDVDDCEAVEQTGCQRVVMWRSFAGKIGKKKADHRHHALRRKLLR